MATEPRRPNEAKDGKRRKWLWGIAAFFAFVALLNIAKKPDGGETPAVPATPETPAVTLTAEQRVEACMDRLTHYRQLGVWTAGGVKPLVSRAAWRELESAEQDEVFATAACIATSGEPRDVFVTVASDDIPPRDLETRRVTVR